MAEFWTILAQIVDPALERAEGETGVAVCRHCQAEAMVPVLGEGRVARPARMLLRCGNCGRRRVARVSDAERVTFERTLERGRREIAGALRKLEREAGER